MTGEVSARTRAIHPAAGSVGRRRTSPAPADGLDTSGLQHVLGYALTLADLGARRAFQQHIGTPHALRPPEFTMLMLLLHNADVTPSQLAETLRASPPNVTVLVDRLVERGLVQRTRSATDGRATPLRLTAKGEALAQRTYRVSLEMEQGFLQPLSAAERAMLAELLHKLARPV